MPQLQGRRDPRHGFLRWRKRSGAHPAPLETGSTDGERQSAENSPSAKSQPASTSLLPRILQPLAARSSCRLRTAFLQVQRHGSQHPCARGTEHEGQQLRLTSKLTFLFLGRFFAPTLHVLPPPQGSLPVSGD